MTEPMRVLLVNQPTDGGVAFHVETLARRLPEHRVSVTVACPPGPWARRLAGAGVAVREVAMVREISLRTDLAALRRLRTALAADEYDLVHAHSAKGGVLGRVAARWRGVPAVYTPHAWSFLAAGGGRSTRLYLRVERVLARSTAAIVCVSEGERRRGLQVTGADRLVMVTNGIALPDHVPVARPAQHRPAAVVGTVARLAPQKGIADLLAAFARVRETRDDVVLRIAGDGPLRAELERDTARRGLGDSVTFVGAVPSPWTFLADLDVFILPSRWEGLPYALLEAMASGLPCIATAVDGVAEAIPDRRFGTVVDVGDQAWLAREIVAMADDPQARAHIGRMAASHVRQAFSVDAMLRGTVETYRRVLDRPAARATPVAAASG